MEYQASYAAGVDTLLAVFADKAFLGAYARALGAVEWDVVTEPGTDLSRTELKMTVPTNGVPAMFKRLVTPTVEITETREWPASSRSADGGTFSVEAEVGRRAARVHGGLTLAVVSAQETLFQMAGDIEVKVPFGRGLAVGLIKDLVTRCLQKQTKVLHAWIPGPDGGTPDIR